MSNNIKVTTSEVMSAVSDLLNQYTVDVQYDIRDLTNRKAERLKDLIKNSSPVNSKRTRHRGKYKKSWRVKVLIDSYAVYEKAVYSNKEYMLTHLLEKGHKTRNGRKTQAQPHIAPAAEKIKKEYINDIQNIVRQPSKNGGGRNTTSKSYKK